MLFTNTKITSWTFTLEPFPATIETVEPPLDRVKSFLTPSIEYSIGGDLGIISPYYIPLNESSDITFNPKVYLNENHLVFSFSAISSHRSC